jgi:hypothetical protein
MLNRNLLAIFISIILSFFFIALSFYPNYWINFFGFLSVPPQIPAFSDFEAHIRFLKCKESGLALYESCFEITKGHSIYNSHPSLWIKIFKLLNLKNLFNFNLLIFFLLIFYFSCLFYLSKFILSFKDKIIFLLATLSTSNLLLVERFATDCVIFLLIFSLIFNIRFFYKYFLFLFAILLKVYPLFVLPFFSNDKKFFFIAILICILGFFFLIDDLAFINKNIVEFSRVFGYGSRSISKGIFLYLNQNNYFVIEDYNSFKNLIILTFLFFVFFIFCLSFFNTKLKMNSYKDLHLIKNHQLFLLGSSVFIFTFIFGSNADYRLIFLFLVLPYVLNYYQGKNKVIFLFCLFISLNSLFFEKGYKYSITYYINVSFVYFCKLILLTYLSYTYGYVIKNYVFFKNKFVK